MSAVRELENKLNAPAKEQRIAAIRELMELYNSGGSDKPSPGENVNNHIHTIYSFSPYSPTMAAYMSWLNGLATAGIMDHDSVAGAEEFVEAGEIIGIAVTVGFECRCNFKGTAFEGKRINNPDQNSVAYLAMHGIPHTQFKKAADFLRPYQEKRNIRNRKMTEKLSGVVSEAGISIDFDRDVAVLSQQAGGGTITERHILYALAGIIMDKAKPGKELVGFLEEKFDIKLSGGSLEKLSDGADRMYRYHLLGVLKGQFVEKFYIDADEELPHYTDFLKLSDEIGAISAYAYLGDVGDSVTGDKKTQKFEDAYLEELVMFLAKSGFKAVTYMPTRNTVEQLRRVIELCGEYNLFQICGEDINSPFQPFICKALEKPEFRHLIDSAWALIGHEAEATKDLGLGMFSEDAILRLPQLNNRINYYSKLGRSGH